MFWIWYYQHQTDPSIPFGEFGKLTSNKEIDNLIGRDNFETRDFSDNGFAEENGRGYTLSLWSIFSIHEMNEMFQKTRNLIWGHWVVSAKYWGYHNKS